MNNLKTDTLLSENTKILIYDYHYFIDYNYLLNLIPKPKISLLAEYCYVDDVERKLLAINKLQYLVELNNEIEIAINKYSIYATLHEFNGLVKNIYYFSQLKLKKEGESKYGEAQLNNYQNNLIESIKLKLSNEYDIFENNEMVDYYLLESQLPKGVKIITFSIDPNDIEPSGTLNMTNMKGQNIEILLKDNYLTDYYNSKNNSNNLGILFKIIYTKYNLFQIEKGKGSLLFY